MAGILEQIEKAGDIKSIEPEDYKQLAREIRKFLVQNVSKTGGHLASNLGTVELTMALHLCMDFPEDKLIWDVGHQSYTHKILTGRKEGFKTLRNHKGMSGFPKQAESECDAFDTGHSSTSISVALGYAQARDLQEENHRVVAVLGDGALSGGMAYEALNNAARMKSNLVIVLNDNSMSISKNVGGMANYLAKIRTSSKYIDLKDVVENTLLKMPRVGSKLVNNIRGAKDTIKRIFIPGMLFEDMGITYLGPIDGHDIPKMMEAFRNAMAVNEAVIVHVNTKKGKGYRLAEKNPSDFHGVEPFNIKTGEKNNPVSETTYTDVFSESMLKLGEKYPELTAVCAAMPNGTGLDKFAETFPKRFFDVGIAEEHAVTFAAGLAAGGRKPVVALYSTFLQRAYDQILHDVCIGRLPVIFAIDRAGIVGKDGETHQGIFDISFLNTMPHMTLLAPKNAKEFEEMLEFLIEFDGPAAIRYPRGAVYEGFAESQEPICYGKAEVLYREKEILLLAAGSMVEIAEEVYKQLKEKRKKATLVNARFLKPFDTELIKELASSHKLLVTMEENVRAGGFGQQVGDYLQREKLNIAHLNISLPDVFVEHGTPEALKEQYGIDANHITESILKKVQERKR